MSKKIQIIKAEPKDALLVVQIFNNARSQMKYLPVVHTSEEIKNYFAGLIKEGSVILAKQDDNIVGFIQIKDGWLNHLYIASGFKNKGIGKHLLDKAKSINPEGLVLWVFEENKKAIKFYEREGFTLQEKRNKQQTTNEENLPDRKYIWKILK